MNIDKNRGRKTLQLLNNENKQLHRRVIGAGKPIERATMKRNKA